MLMFWKLRNRFQHFKLNKSGKNILQYMKAYKMMATSSTSEIKCSRIIAVTQMKSTNNKDENMTVVKNLVSKAAGKGAHMVFLPECCDYIGETKKETMELTESLSGPTIESYCQLAKSLNIWLSVGGIHIKENDEEKLRNTHLIIDNKGNIKSKYEKTHLFNVKIPAQNIDLQESKYVEEGKCIENPVLTPCGSVALGICYDMRFPEFSILQRQLGAQVLTFPSAFTVATGLAHWHTLLKARAIETQCYVVAAAQTGQHNSKRSSFGHAIIVDPWGTVIAEVSEGTNIALAEIDLEYLEKVRREMPVMSHRRKDLYSLNGIPTSSVTWLTEVLPFPSNYLNYPFGHVSIPGSCVFLQTSFSYAFVNKRPFTDGHVLVSPQNPVERFCDMKQKDVSDFAQAILLTLKVLIDKNKSSNFLIAIQDGKCAGQTIKHVHAHLMPKESLPFIEDHEAKIKREWRNTEDMEEEASALRKHTLNILKYSDWLSTTAIPKTFTLKDPKEMPTLNMASLSIRTDDVFLYTGNCLGVLAENPILPGHVCVYSCKEVSRLNDLSPREVTDLFLSVQAIECVLEAYFKVSSTTIYMKYSSEEKGICAHVIPRNISDLKDNDNIYELLESYQPDKMTELNGNLLAYLKKSFTLTN